MRLLAVIAAFTIVVTACAGSSTDQADERPDGLGRTDTFPLSDVAAVPAPDTTIADVELADVVFDTFGGPPRTLADATDEERRGLFDAIPPLDLPQYDAAGVDDWLEDDDAVLGYLTPGGVPIAYPHKILNLHEIVNDEFDGVPVLVSYCPLCSSGVVYDRRPDDLRQTAPLSFSNTSALYENDLVMVDRETGSYWWQTAGRSLVGVLTGAQLPVLPSSTATWVAWRDAYPDTLVLSRNTGFDRTYDRDPFAGYADRVDQGVVPFPASPDTLADDRLASSALVVAVELDGSAWAVPIDELSPGDRVDLGNTGARVELGPTGVPTAVDSTGATLPTRTSMWFALVAALPEVEVVRPG